MSNVNKYMSSFNGIISNETISNVKCQPNCICQKSKQHHKLLNNTKLWPTPSCFCNVESKPRPSEHTSTLSSSHKTMHAHTAFVTIMHAHTAFVTIMHQHASQQYHSPASQQGERSILLKRQLKHNYYWICFPHPMPAAGTTSRRSNACGHGCSSPCFQNLPVYDWSDNVSQEEHCNHAP
jgi:hypothetical protein